MKIIKHVHRGEVLPPFYGVAWIKWHTDGAVAMPIPFNIVAAVLRSVWVFFKHGHVRVQSNPRDAYAQGRRDERKGL